MPDDAEDVMGVITQLIEDRYQMPLDDLRRAVSAAPQANREATEVVRWYGLLTEAHEVLERAEEALAAALADHVDAYPNVGTQPDDDLVELPDPVMQLARRVNAAYTAREGRAMTVRWLLDPNAIGKRSRGAGRVVSATARRNPALQTTASKPPASASSSARGAVR